MESKSYHFPSVFLCNPRSLNNKMDEFRSVVMDQRFDACAIPESWFKPERSLEHFDIDGYCLYSRSRTSTMGGGVAFYIREEFNPCQLPVDVPENLEVIWVKARPERLPRSVSLLIFAVLYFPDQKQETNMLEHIQNTLDSLHADYPDAGVCIMGDLNHLKDSSLCKYNKFKQVVKCPTRGEATLEKIVTNLGPYYLDPIESTPIGLSDHSTVIMMPKPEFAKKTNTYTKRTVRPIKVSGIRSFGLMDHPA